jgi:hypothetical protein
MTVKIAMLAPMPSVSVSTAHRGPRRRFPEYASTTPEVAETCQHAAERSHFALDFAARRDVSKLAACGVPRIPGTHPGADELFDEEAEVKIHFLIEIALRPSFSRSTSWLTCSMRRAKPYPCKGRERRECSGGSQLFVGPTRELRVSGAVRRG